MPFDAAVLKKKIGPLPVGVWALIGFGLIALYAYKKKQAANAAATTADPNSVSGDSTGDTTDAGTSPYSDLASSDYGQFPMTGGGAPPVYNGAIRLQPNTLRIQLIRPKPKPKPHHKPPIHKPPIKKH